MTRRPPFHRSGGFTLIEVLVSLFILSIMAAMAWQGVDSVVRTRDVAQTKMESMLRLQTVMAQWDADLTNIVDTQTVPAVQFDGASLRLTRRNPDGVQVVVWSLRSGAVDRWTAAPVTRIDALQDAWMKSLQLMGDERGHLRALPGVEQWQVYFYRNNAWTNAQSTGDVSSAAVAQARRLEAPPQGVRVIMSFAAGSGLTGGLARDVRIAP